MTLGFYYNYLVIQDWRTSKMHWLADILFNAAAMT